MKNRINILTLATAFSLTAMLALQVYFLYASFQEESLDFKNEINSSIELVLPEMREARKAAIHNLHLQDIMNPELLGIEWGINEEQEEYISLVDPKTGDKRLTYVGITGIDKILTKEQALDSLMDKLRWNNSKMEMYFSITDEIDKRRGAYQDSVLFDLVLFREKLDVRLQEREISGSYEFTYFEAEDGEWPVDKEISSDAFELFKGADIKVAVAFDQPVLNVIKRMYLIILVSIIVVILIGLCFYALVRTINRQRKLSDMKDDFVDSMTHELLTPIATLKIALESLEKPKTLSDSALQLKYLDVSKKELSRVSDIVHNVLYTSLHEQEGMTLKKEQVNVNEVLQGLVTYHKERSDKLVEFELDELESPLIETDKQQFTNVLHNLIDNAIKYASGDLVKVKIALSQNTSDLEITISDNGQGIPPEHQSRIFDKFHRAVDPSKQSIKGLGVGLYYVKNALVSLGGSIQLLNSSVNGSSFRVSLQNVNHEA